MAATYYAGAISRAQWAGANADVDIHLEAYEGDIEGSFKVDSIFRSSGLTNFKSVANSSNTWRGDRIGGAVVQGRKSGVTLDSTRIANDKLIVTVDTTSYIRTPVDYQDNWTAPDYRSEYSMEHGTAHAKAFDQAHVIQLIKCGAFVAPAHLKTGGAWNDGITAITTGLNAAAATATLTVGEVQADIIVQTHKAQLTKFVKRDMGGSLAETITLIHPDFFNILLEHKKLMNVDFQGGSGGNDFSGRRIAVLNGVRIMETPRFPDAAIASHFLGPAFNVSAAEAKCRMIIFFPKKALVTVEAAPMTVRFWDDPREFSNVLDSYTMYTVGQKRPDAVAVIFAE